MNAVTDAILSTTSNQEIREAMLLGSGLESGWNPTAVGDQGTSFGPFQMHIGGALTAAGGTPQQAEDPTWATQHMLGAYTSGVRSVPQSLWNSNPEQAAEEAAVAAERPQVSYYQSQGQAQVDRWWSATQGVLHGNPGIGGAPGGPGGVTTTADTSPQNVPVNPATSFIGGLLGSLGLVPTTAQFADILERLGLIILGGLLILLGIYMLVGRQAFAMSPLGSLTPTGQAQRERRSERFAARQQRAADRAAADRRRAEAERRRTHRTQRTAAQEERAERTLGIRERRVALAERTEARHAGGGAARPGRRPRP